MSRILIFSDNIALIKLWSSALTPAYQVDTISDVFADLNADAVIIDTIKIDTNEKIFSIFNTNITRFLVIGTAWSEDNQIKALVSGAAGYCGESEPTQLLIQAIESILRGDLWIQRHLVPRVIGTLVQMNTPPVVVPTVESEKSTLLLNTLSNRELDVAQMVRTGNNNKVIASSLNISERTVKAHLTSIFKKLNVSDRLHLALFIREFS
ncbi:MAG: DNA-binding response regulator [Methylococcaceae bacterium]